MYPSITPKNAALKRPRPGCRSNSEGSVSIAKICHKTSGAAPVPAFGLSRRVRPALRSGGFLRARPRLRPGYLVLAGRPAYLMSLDWRRWPGPAQLAGFAGPAAEGPEPRSGPPPSVRSDRATSDRRDATPAWEAGAAVAPSRADGARP